MAKRLRPGQMIGELEIVRTIHEGAKAISYLARATDGRMLFAKQFNSPGRALPWFEAFVEHQKLIHLALRNSTSPDRFPNLVSSKVFDSYGLIQVYPFFEAARDLEAHLGETSGLLQRDGASAHARLTLARTLCFVVKEMHRVGIAHLDLKPANVLLVPNTEVSTGHDLRLIDFDFAVHAEVKEPWPRAWGFVGTAGYESPEHCDNSAQPSSASDVFSLGLVLCQLLGDFTPFADASTQELYRESIRTSPRLSPSSLTWIKDQGDASRVCRMIASALSPNPAFRPSAAELHRSLLAPSGFHTNPTPGAEEAREPAPRAPRTVAGCNAESGIRPCDGPPSYGLVLLTEAGVQLRVDQPKIFGRRHLERAGVAGARIAGTEQFALHRERSGVWQIEHCYGARVRTYLSGELLQSGCPKDVIAGDRIELIGSDGAPQVLLTVQPAGYAA